MMVLGEAETTGELQMLCSVKFDMALFCIFKAKFQSTLQTLRSVCTTI